MSGESRAVDTPWARIGALELDDDDNDDVVFLPFLWWIDQDNARLHAIRIDTLDIALEVFELFHGLCGRDMLAFSERRDPGDTEGKGVLIV
jgi:hypothetical protein